MRTCGLAFTFRQIDSRLQIGRAWRVPYPAPLGVDVKITACPFGQAEFLDVVEKDTFHFAVRWVVQLFLQYCVPYIICEIP